MMGEGLCIYGDVWGEKSEGNVCIWCEGERVDGTAAGGSERDLYKDTALNVR